MGRRNYHKAFGTQIFLWFGFREITVLFSKVSTRFLEMWEQEEGTEERTPKTFAIIMKKCLLRFRSESATKKCSRIVVLPQLSYASCCSSACSKLHSILGARHSQTISYTLGKILLFQEKSIQIRKNPFLKLCERQIVYCFVNRPMRSMYFRTCYS